MPHYIETYNANDVNALSKRCEIIYNLANGENLQIKVNPVLKISERIVGIYLIQNMINNKIYIGQTKDYLRRVQQHKNRAKRKEYKMYSRLYPAINKHNIKNFKFLLIEECKSEMLNEREIYWINFFDSFQMGYNATIGGHSSVSYWSGKKRSLESNEKIRKTLTGTKLPEETKRKISESHKGKHPLSATLKRMKKVVCIEKNYLFDSILEAGKFCKRDSSGIVKVLKGDKKTCGGYHWEYSDKLSVETIETCQLWQGSRVGLDNSFNSKSIEPKQNKADGYEIVHTEKMENSRVSDRGWLTLVRRSKQIKWIDAFEVSTEEFQQGFYKVTLGLRPDIKHERMINIDVKADGSNLAHVYAVCELMNGSIQFKSLSKEQIENYRKRSPSQRKKVGNEYVYNPTGAWFTDYPAMAKAKALKQLCKFLPLEEFIQEALATDEAVINEDAVKGDKVNLASVTYPDAEAVDATTENPLNDNPEPVDATFEEEGNVAEAPPKAEEPKEVIVPLSWKFVRGAKKFSNIQEALKKEEVTGYVVDADKWTITFTEELVKNPKVIAIYKERQGIK